MTGPSEIDGHDDQQQLREQLNRLLRYRVVIFSCMALGVSAGLIYALCEPSSYTSISEVLVRSHTDPFSSTFMPANQQVNMANEQQIATSTDVAVRAAHTLGRPESQAEDLKDDVRVTSPSGSQLLRFEFSASSAESAKQGVDAFAGAYLDDRWHRNDAAVARGVRALELQVEALEKQAHALAGTAIPTMQTEIDTWRKRIFELKSFDTSGGDIVRKGDLPSSPTGLGWRTSLFCGVATGAALGILLARLCCILDSRVHSARDVEAALHAPVLATLPSDDRGHSALAVGESPRDHTYRTLAYRIRRIGRFSGTSRLLVVADRRGVAASAVAARLANALADAGDQVLLMDACPDPSVDKMRFSQSTTSPSIRWVASRPGEKKLIEVGNSGLFEWPSSDGSAFSRRTPAYAESDSQMSPDAPTLVMIIATPPLLEHAEALASLQRVDNVLLVTRLGTRREDLTQVHDLIGYVRGRLLGAVLDGGGHGGRHSAGMTRRSRHGAHSAASSPAREYSDRAGAFGISRG